MQGRRLKYLDPISSPCEGIGELSIGHKKKSTFNASDRDSSLFPNALTVLQKQKKKKKKKKKSTKDDRELLSVTQVIGGIEKVFVEFIFFCYCAKSYI